MASDPDEWPSGDAAQEYPGGGLYRTREARWQQAVAAALAVGALQVEIVGDDLVWEGTCPRCGHHTTDTRPWAITVPGSLGGGVGDLAWSGPTSTDDGAQPTETVDGGVEFSCDCSEGHPAATAESPAASANDDAGDDGASTSPARAPGCGWGRGLDVFDVVVGHLGRTA